MRSRYSQVAQISTAERMPQPAKDESIARFCDRTRQSAPALRSTRVEIGCTLPRPSILKERGPDEFRPCQWASEFGGLPALVALRSDGQTAGRKKLTFERRRSPAGMVSPAKIFGSVRALFLRHPPTPCRHLLQQRFGRARLQQWHLQSGQPKHMRKRGCDKQVRLA
jgi:hypothetical protein